MIVNLKINIQQKYRIKVSLARPLTTQEIYKVSPSTQSKKSKWNSAKIIHFLQVKINQTPTEIALIKHRQMN